MNRLPFRFSIPGVLTIVLSFLLPLTGCLDFNAIHTSTDISKMWLSEIVIMAFVITLTTHAFLRKQQLLLSIDDIVLLTGICFLVGQSLAGVSAWGEKHIMFISLVLLYITFKYAINTGLRPTGPFLVSILLCLALQLIAGIMQYHGLYHRYTRLYTITGNFLSGSHYAMYLNCLLPLPLALVFFAGKRPLLNVLGWVLLAALLYVLVLLQSRTSWCCLLLTFFLFGFFRYKEWFTGKRTRYAIAATCLLVFAVVFYFFLRVKNDSTEGRKIIYSISTQIAFKHIIWGVGFGNYPVYYNRYQAAFIEENPQEKESAGRIVDFNRNAYNDFLEIFCEQGIAGLALFIAFCGITFRNGFKKLRLISWKAFPGIPGPSFSFIVILISFLIFLSVLFSALFYYPFSIFPAEVLFFMACAVINAKAAGGNESIAPGRAARYFSYIVQGAGLLIGCILLYLTIARVIAYRRFAEIRAVYTVSKSNERYNKEFTKQMDGLYGLLKDDAGYTWFYARQLIQLNRLDSAVGLINANLNTNSCSFRFYYLLSDVYMLQKKYTENEYLLNYISNMVPKLIEPRYRLSLLYLQTNRLSEYKSIAEEILYVKNRFNSRLVEAFKKSTSAKLDSLHAVCP